jgi:3-oxoadipate enol-lactonase
VVAAFSDRYRILRYDTRGHGASGVLNPPYSLPALGNDLLELLDKLNVQRFLFCGISLGGLTGMWLGLNAPERVQALVLANTASRIGNEESWNARIERVQAAGLEPMANEIMERWFTEQTRTNSKEAVERARKILISTSPLGYAGCCAALRDIDLTSSLHRIQAPTLVIAGTSDPATPPSQGKMLSESIRGAAYVELPTSHLSAIEQPEAFSSAVRAFFDKLEK